MDENEIRQYPIRNAWLLRAFTFNPLDISYALAPFIFSVYIFSVLLKDSQNFLIIFTSMCATLVFFLIHKSFFLVIIILRRKNFSFSLEDDFFVVKQGIVSKIQRNIPYGVIQNIIINQDFFDRMFGLASLSLENASGSGGINTMDQSSDSSGFMSYLNNRETNRKKNLNPGSYGNSVYIPGLSKDDAVNLKEILLRKINENKMRDSGGL